MYLISLFSLLLLLSLSLSLSLSLQPTAISAEIQQDLPLNTIVFRNQPASLDCIATGAPPPSYQWLKDNIPLSEPFEINPTNGTLRISIAADVHNGQYRCRATNQIGTRVIGRDETSTTVTVISKQMMLHCKKYEKSVQ